MDSEKITIRRPDDFHVHFRQDKLMQLVTPFTAKVCGRAIAMPNTEPPILTADDADEYKRDIMAVVRSMSPKPNFEPLMTIKITDQTTPAMIVQAKEAGVIAGKIYPVGATTNSDKGVSDFAADLFLRTLSVMQDYEMLLLIHGETVEDRILLTKREGRFLPTLIRLASKFPNLKIVLEHISTKEAVELIKDLSGNVTATITAHHLYATLNNVLDGGTQPHNHCMPVPKDFDDCDALIEAAISGLSCFFNGSDTAAHWRTNKECAKGACGAFTAPHLFPLLAQKFEEHNALDKLEDFTSRFGAEFYGLPLNKGTTTLIKKPWTIPAEYSGVVPFMAKEELQWQLEK